MKEFLHCRDCKHDKGKCVGASRRGGHKNCFERKTLTNADRIRAMSDEELAQLIYQGISSDACDYCKENDHHCTGRTCQGKADAEVILEWLRQPAEEVH